MVKIENSKKTILNLAEALLQDMGFNGFSYAHIASELGVKNAAIHYHFPTKEDLGRAVIQRYRDRFKLWVNNSRVKDLASQEKLDWFFSIYTAMRADQGKKDVRIYAAVLDGQDITRLKRIEKGIILIGNESKGIGADILELANVRITIPRKGNAESLNAAVATGILLSHLT